MGGINNFFGVGLLFLLNLTGCVAENRECPEENIRIEAKKESTCHCEHHELYKEYNDLSTSRFLFETFIRYAAKYSIYGAALDNDFSIFIDYHDKYASHFIYTKNKEKNFVYSTLCGVAENLSSKRLEGINHLEKNDKGSLGKSSRR